MFFYVYMILTKINGKYVSYVGYTKNLKVIKSSILNDKHISCILKSKIGFSIKSISFDSINSEIGKYLLNYKKDFNVIGQIEENFWNNKRTLQLIIKDIIL